MQGVKHIEETLVNEVFTLFISRQAEGICFNSYWHHLNLCGYIELGDLTVTFL